MLTVILHITTKTSTPREFHILGGNVEPHFTPTNHLCCCAEVPRSSVRALAALGSIFEVVELPQGVKGSPTAPHGKAPCIVVATFSGDSQNASDVGADGKERGTSPSSALPASTRANDFLIP